MKRFIFKVEKMIRSVHPYEVPEIIALKIDRISGSYGKWMDEVLS